MSTVSITLPRPPCQNLSESHSVNLHCCKQTYILYVHTIALFALTVIPKLRVRANCESEQTVHPHKRSRDTSKGSQDDSQEWKEEKTHFRYTCGVYTGVCFSDFPLISALFLVICCLISPLQWMWKITQNKKKTLTKLVTTSRNVVRESLHFRGQKPKSFKTTICLTNREYPLRKYSKIGYGVQRSFAKTIFTSSLTACLVRFPQRSELWSFCYGSSLAPVSIKEGTRITVTAFPIGYTISSDSTAFCLSLPSTSRQCCVHTRPVCSPHLKGELSKREGEWQSERSKAAQEWIVWNMMPHHWTK